MNNIAALVAIVLGVVLLAMGFNASESISSEISEAVNGTPNNQALWLLIVGSVLTILGSAKLILRRS